VLTYAKNLLRAEHFALLWHAAAGVERNGKSVLMKTSVDIADTSPDERVHQVPWSDGDLVPRESCTMDTLQGSGTPHAIGGMADISAGVYYGSGLPRAGHLHLRSDELDPDQSVLRVQLSGICKSKSLALQTIHG
jgi:hypothetical protein